MGDVEHIGCPPWTREDLIESIDEFAEIYANRPIRDNQGGMKAPHMFAVWFMARTLAPDIVVESGIWKGQSTWLLEQACPDSRLVCIDPNLAKREYISETATYSDRDFSEQDWSLVTDRSLVFFDDHQNAYNRLQQCKWFGFKNAIFEDNYPVPQGDCYSLKKAFAGAGFNPAHSRSTAIENGVLFRIVRRLANAAGITSMTLTPRYSRVKVAPNDIDAHILLRQLDIYYEFPPLFRTEKTRWGDEWDDSIYPTPEPLLDQVKEPTQELLLAEAMYYTWICYVRLR